MSEALRPCPFCGDDAFLMVQHLSGTVRKPAYRVACDNCGASSRYSDIDHIEAWNERVAPPILGTVLDMLNSNASRDNVIRVIEQELGGDDACDHCGYRVKNRCENAEGRSNCDLS